MGVMDSPANGFALKDAGLDVMASDTEGRRSRSESLVSIGIGVGASSVVVIGVMATSPLPSDGLRVISEEREFFRVLDP